jgi:hypothetical protein
MSIFDKVAKLEKRIEKLAARGDVPLEPVEIRRAVLDAVEALVEPGPRARRVFPFNRLDVAVVVADARRRASIDTVLGGEAGLRAAIEERLREEGCAKVDGLEVKLRYVRKPGADWQTGRVYRVSGQSAGRAEDVPRAGRAPDVEAVNAQLVVLKGTATKKSLTLGAERTNIGRIAEVLDKERRVARRNQVVFPEGADPANDTVSRAQAHIVRSPGGEYRLFDDRSAHGTRIFRAGRTIELPSGSPRGVRLETGDEIYFGQACVRFEIK